MTATWSLPSGETWQSQTLTQQPGSDEWVYTPGAYAYADLSAQIGTWTITVTAMDAAEEVLATSQIQILGRDPKSAAKPRVVLLATVGSTVVKRRQTWRDYDGWWTEIRATVRYFDPDHVVGYSFISDKVKRRPGSSNWTGAKVVRTGDYIQLTDSIPVRDKVGEHRLSVRADSFTPSSLRWGYDWVQGLPARHTWTLRHWKNFKH